MAAPDNTYHDSHFHLTNYIQEGPSLKQYLEIMGSRVGRSTVFGLPVHQMWSFQNSGNYAPTYYLQSDAPMYYYSFTDAWIATQYNALSAEEKTHFDPLISGFHPADMYATAHVKRTRRWINFSILRPKLACPYSFTTIWTCRLPNPAPNRFTLRS